MGLREDVKKGKISIDEALETAKDYHGGIRGWLIKFKESNRTVPDSKKKRKYKKKSSSTNFQL